MEESERLRLRFTASQVFTPSAPIDKFGLFSGRKDQVNQIFTSVGQKGEHVILYGERGVGKTSLANVLAEQLRAFGLKDLHSVKANCDIKEDFTGLWHRVFRELMEQAESEIQNDINLVEILEKKVAPDDVRYFLQRFPGTTIVIIDELDRIEDRATSKLLADTIKGLSDHAVPATLVLVGVGDSVDALIEDHKSIERALVQIPMPPMSVDELGEIIDKGLSKLKMKITDEAKRHITSLSQGLAHYTHLLALVSVEEAVDSDRTEIIFPDVQRAVTKAIHRTNMSHLQDYVKATESSQKDALYQHVLLACAFAEKDDLGYFFAADVRGPLSVIKSKRYEIPAFVRHLNHLCQPSRGGVLKAKGESRRVKYRFVDPQMRPFVVMNGLAKNLITQDTWNALSGLN